MHIRPINESRPVLPHNRRFPFPNKSPIRSSAARAPNEARNYIITEQLSNCATLDSCAICQILQTYQTGSKQDKSSVYCLPTLLIYVCWSNAVITSCLAHCVRDRVRLSQSSNIGSLSGRGRLRTQTNCYHCLPQLRV